MNSYRRIETKLVEKSESDIVVGFRIESESYPNPYRRIEMKLVEKSESHIVVGFFLRLVLGGGFGLFDGSGGGFRRSCGGGGGDRSGQGGEFLRVGQHLLDLLRFFEGVVRLHGHGQQVSESVRDHVRNGRR